MVVLMMVMMIVLVLVMHNDDGNSDDSDGDDDGMIFMDNLASDCVLYISTQISRFMWSTPADTLTPNRSPTFAVLHHDGSVEVFDVQKKSVLKKQVEEKCLTHIGLLTPVDIKGVLKGANFITN